MHGGGVRRRERLEARDQRVAARAGDLQRAQHLRHPLDEEPRRDVRRELRKLRRDGAGTSSHEGKHPGYEMTRARDTGRAPGERQQRVTDQRRFQSQIGGFRIIRRFEQLVAVQREAKGSLRRAPRLVVVDPFARFADLHGLLEAVERQLGQGAFIADGNRVVVEVFHDGRQRGGDPTDHGGALGGFSGKLAEVLSRLPASPVLHQIGENRVEPEGVAPLYGRARSVLLESRGRAALLQLNLAQSLGVHPHLVSLRPEAGSQS